MTEIVNDTRPSYQIDDFKQRYNGALIKKTELLLTENNTVMEKIIIP